MLEIPQTFDDLFDSAIFCNKWGCTVVDDMIKPEDFK